MDYLGDKLDEIKEEKLVEDESTEDFVLYKFKKEVPFTIEKENDVYVVKGKEVERLFCWSKSANTSPMMSSADRKSFNFWMS